MPTRLQVAKNDILSLFDDSTTHVYSKKDLATIKQQNKDFWRLAESTTTDLFIEFLLKAKLHSVQLKSENYSDLTRYAWGEVSPYELAVSIVRDSYLSHGTAASLHGLTQQILKTIYVNREQSPKPSPRSPLTQDKLDIAFSRKQRTSQYYFNYQTWRFMVIRGKHTGRLEVGVVHDANGVEIPVTNLERTLIDMVVRPEYSGGVYQVLEAFRSARNRMSSNTLFATLKKLNYVYPYHQAIGFYMQRAGYEPRRWMRFKNLQTSLNFYLAHGMTETDFESEWRLFIPKGFK